jgi:hypothetical protein
VHYAECLARDAKSMVWDAGTGVDARGGYPFQPHFALLHIKALTTTPITANDTNSYQKISNTNKYPYLRDH